MLPSNGRQYGIRVAGGVSNSSFVGNIEVWAGAIFFDTSDQALNFSNNAVSIDQWNANTSLMMLGRPGDANPVASFNGNDFRIGSTAQNFTLVNNRNFQGGAGNDNTFWIRSFQPLDPIWTTSGFGFSFDFIQMPVGLSTNHWLVDGRSRVAVEYVKNINYSSNTSVRALFSIKFGLSSTSDFLRWQ